MLKPNTFAAACFEQNTVQELIDALKSDHADQGDCAAWGISESEWREQIALALEEKLASSAAAALGRSKTPAKAAAARANGAKGGRPTKYAVTYQLHEGLSEADVNSVRSFDEMATLAEIASNCVEVGVDAELFDRAGFRKGFVRADGSHTLN